MIKKNEIQSVYQRVAYLGLQWIKLAFKTLSSIFGKQKFLEKTYLLQDVVLHFKWYD